MERIQKEIPTTKEHGGHFCHNSR